MKDAAEGDKESAKNLKMEILNIPEWEEAVFFACERLSRSDSSGAEATAAVQFSSRYQLIPCSLPK